MIRNTDEWRQVAPTAEERDEWRRKHPRRYPPHRAECRACGTRIWYVGIAIGAHRRACKGTAK